MRDRARFGLHRVCILLGFCLVILLGCNLITRIPKIIFGPGATPTQASSPMPIVTDIPTFTPPPPPTYTPVPKAPVSPQPSKAALPDPLAFIYTPLGVLSNPYILLTGFAPTDAYSIQEIEGHLNQVGFTCPGTRCALPLTGDAVIFFRAHATTGESSATKSATIRVNQTDGGYLVTLESLVPEVVFTDACNKVWGQDFSQIPEWAFFPQSPAGLNTSESLHYLASQLLWTGAVKAEDCPGGGFTQDAPNACGIERANTALIDGQNLFDFKIWEVGLDIGIPPILLKTLIEYESQFWPESTRYFLDEYGLGQINELGTDAALRWNIDLYQQVCNSVLFDCPKSYYRLSPQLRAMLRGALTKELDADCQTCPYGIDLEKAQQSVQTIAQVMRYTCSDVMFIMDKNQYSASYEDYWKFTMATYHSGAQCLQDALTNIAGSGTEINWDKVSMRFSCPGTKEYVDGLWDSLGKFRSTLLKPGERLSEQVEVIYNPTRTPEPTPTPYNSSAEVRVTVYLDKNGNGRPEAGELLDGIQVELRLADGALLAEQTANGEVIFDVSGHKIGLRATVSLPGLYRVYNFRLPADGTVPVTFVFSEPPFPSTLP